MIIISCKYKNDIKNQTSYLVPNKFPYIGTSSTISDVILACETYMPNEKIVVVDSNSEDKSYFDFLRDKNIDIIEGNSNYEVGAIWMAYNKYPNESHYMFLQDTVIPVTDLTQHYPQQDNEVVSFLYTTDFNSCEPGEMEWCIDSIKTTDIPPLLSGFRIFCFNLFIARNYFLKDLKNHNFHRILPTNKSGSACMERLLGMAATQLGYSTKFLVGHIHMQTDTYNLHSNPYIIKNFGERQ